ncbi:hypothetical protein [Natrinema marinum]|uniref:hypothetical protein n=1 Tax=Natrinema marinum TaxID=2961598 RepID=UPI0020C8AB15|nr:hypothetical protein [Natrinema marinum]
MSAAVVFALLFAMALVIPLVLWAAISQETAEPTVVDRAEAERIAKERGGRGSSRSTAPPDGADCGDQHEEFGWNGRRLTTEERDDGDEGDERRGF